MTLQHILKNSSQSGKEPLASQLANGEIALNYHADGPFLTCKDTAGTVRRLTGVWVGASAPGSPTPGELWLDISITPNQLKIYKDSTDSWVFAGNVANASTSAVGVVELATDAETQAGSDTQRAVTPASLQSKISDSTITVSATTIASSSAVKTTYDLANAALPKTGGTVTGALEIGTTGSLVFEGSTANDFETTLAVTDPTADRTITLPNVSGTVITTGDTGTVTSTMLATDLALSGSPTAQTQSAGTNNTTLATTAFVMAAADAARQGLTVKQACRAATTANITLSGTQTIDGVAVVAGDRVLVKNQTTAAENGIYICAASGWTRATDFDADADLLDGAFTFVEEGTANADSGWVLTTNGPITVGVTSLAFVQFSGAGQITAGSGLSKNANTLSVASGGITSDMLADGTIINADVNAAAAIAGTKISPNFGSQNVTTTGQMLVGTSTAVGSVESEAGSITPQKQLVGSSYAGASAALVRTSGGSAQLFIATGSPGNNHLGGRVGGIYFNAFHTDAYYRAASIEVETDPSTVGANDMPARLVFSTTADGASVPTERMRIDDAGLITAGSTNTSGMKALRLNSGQVDTTGGLLALRTVNNLNGGYYVAFHNSANTVIGTITQASATSVAYNTTSDYRLKENVIPLEGAVDRLIQIPVHRFNFIAEPETLFDGFLAHEVQEIVPECVTGEKDAVDDEGNPVYQGIDQSKLVPLLTAALQEAIGEIESLKARVAALEAP